MSMAERIERALSVFDGKEQCPSCDGQGSELIEGDDGVGYYAQLATCELCHGNGWVIEEPCIACGAPVIVGQPVEEQHHDEGCPVQEHPGSLAVQAQALADKARSEA